MTASSNNGAEERLPHESYQEYTFIVQVISFKVLDMKVVPSGKSTTLLGKAFRLPVRRLTHTIHD
jgi:hypothetical protein